MLFIWKQQGENWGIYRDGQWVMVGGWSKLVQYIQSIPVLERSSAVLFVASGEFITVQQQLPAKQARAITHTAAAYLLDGLIMTTVESLHVRYKSDLKPLEPMLAILNSATEPAQDDTPMATINLLALDGQTPNNYHQLLGLANISLVGLMPDFMLLPVPELGRSSVLPQKDGLLLRHNQWFGEFIDNGLLAEPLVAEALAARELALPIQVDSEQALQACNNAMVIAPDVLYHPYNFITQTKVKGLSAYSKALITVFVMLAVLMVVGFVLKTNKIDQQIAQQHSQNEQYMRTLMQGKAILPPVLSLQKMTALLKEQKERLPEQQFLAVQLLDSAASNVAAAGCKLSSAQYQPGQLQLLVRCDSMGQVNQAIDSIRQAGYTVEQSGAAEQAGRATATLLIGGEA